MSSLIGSALSSFNQLFAGILDFISTLPLGVLYCIAGGVAAFENIFPPFPSDIVVAFTVFASARLNGPFWVAAAVVTVGSSAGAILMYYVGRTLGSSFVASKMERFNGQEAIDRFQKMRAQYGIFALLLSRFIPGVRAIVPPLAGAMRIPMIFVLPAIFLASAVWYTTIAYIAYQAGSNWDLVTERINTSGRVFGVSAAVIAIIGVAVWYLRRRRNRE